MVFATLLVSSSVVLIVEWNKVRVPSNCLFTVVVSFSLFLPLAVEYALWTWVRGCEVYRVILEDVLAVQELDSTQGCCRPCHY